MSLHTSTVSHGHPLPRTAGARGSSSQLWLLLFVRHLLSPVCCHLGRAGWLTRPAFPGDSGRFPLSITNPPCLLPHSQSGGCSLLAEKRGSDKRIMLMGVSVASPHDSILMFSSNISRTASSPASWAGPRTSWSSRGVQGPYRPQAGYRCTTWRSGKVILCEDKDGYLRSRMSSFHKITVNMRPEGPRSQGDEFGERFGKH